MHYGLYSIWGRGEKSMYFDRIPKVEYRNLMEWFTADSFSGRAIAKLTKETGMKYACLTARHHDGFSLYDTHGINTYDALHSAAKCDLIRDFVDGCHSEGIVPFLYYTTLDWYDERCDNAFPEYIDCLIPLYKSYANITVKSADSGLTATGADRMRIDRKKTLYNDMLLST